MVAEILRTIQRICKEEGVPQPNIFTEFGIFTVGESGVTLYSILDEAARRQELWYVDSDGAFITNLPDTWALNQRFIMLAVHGWQKGYKRLQLRGLTCDSQDYYNAEKHIYQVFLPERKPTDEQPLYVGFFHTRAYQESLSGYGGISTASSRAQARHPGPRRRRHPYRHRFRAQANGREHDAHTRLPGIVLAVIPSTARNLGMPAKCKF